MNLQYLSNICFTICIVCIVPGTVLSLAMIWGEIRNNAFVWKSWLTVGVLFLASALTLSVTRTLGGRAEPRDDKQGVVLMVPLLDTSFRGRETND